MKSLFNFALFFLCLSCSTTKQVFVNNQECNQPKDFFEFNDSEKYFDVSVYDDRLKNGDVLLKEDNDTKSELIDLGDNEVSVVETDKARHLTKWKRYKNGIIKRFFIEYEYGNAKLGDELEFNEKGSLLRTINHDMGYVVCWDQAIKIINEIAKKDIENYQINKFYLIRNDLNEFPETAAEWRVSMEGNENYDQDGTTFYILDGQNGKLKRKLVSKTTY